MGRAQSKSMLSRSIAEVLGTAEPTVNTSARPKPLRKSLIYTSMALLAINPAQVSAVSLGELNVNSRLGQPLNATVPITLAPGESLPKNCVAPTRGNSGIGSPTNLQVSTPIVKQPGTYNLRVTTTTALHEPMYEISLLIDCPGTPVLLRQYMLMLDLPAMTVPQNNVLTPATSPTHAPAIPVTTNSAPSQLSSPVATTARNTRSLQRSQSPIPAGQSYRVRSGDTLSTIAARIDGRAPDTTWAVADLIFASNPNAFVNSNPDLIKLGSVVDIPAVPELLAVATGRSTATSIIAARTLAARREVPNEPRPTTVPAPIPKAVAAPQATSWPDVLVTEPEQLVTAQSSTPNADLVAGEEAVEPVLTQPITPVVTNAGDAAVITPFLDEQPVPPAADNAIEPAGNADVDPIPVVTTTPRSEATDAVSPLLAIFVGMLLGVLISLLLLRRKLTDAVASLLRRGTTAAGALAGSAVAGTDEDTIENERLGSFDTSAAESAFITQQGLPRPEPLAGSPDSTYIVETSDAEATAQENTPIIDPGTLEETPASPDNDMLAQLFDDEASTLGEYDYDIFDPTGGVDTAVTGTFAGPTADMRRPTDDEIFDPTEELPVELDGDVCEPTAEMRSVEHDSLPNDTVEMPPETGEPTLESELSALPSADEDALSQTLQEALSLLERDFNDEFTASQIIERSEISRSLDAESTESVDANDSTLIAKRKLTR